MADASKGLPVSHLPKDHQLRWIRDWHEQQIVHLDHNNGRNRDQKSILRSERTIKTIDYVLSGQAAMNLPEFKSG